MADGLIDSLRIFEESVNTHLASAGRIKDNRLTENDGDNVITAGEGNDIINGENDDDNAFSDMLFYNMIVMAAKGQW